MKEQVRIKSALLQLNGLQDVSERVIGPKAYLSGQVRSEFDKARAVDVFSSFSNPGRQLHPGEPRAVVRDAEVLVIGHLPKFSS
jgi:hypothetical protein